METSINTLTVIALHFITHMKCFDSTKAKQQDLLRPSLLCVGGGPKINKNSSFLQPHRTLKLRDEKQLCKGVYILWNGRGMNTEKAFSVLMIYVVDSVPAELWDNTHARTVPLLSEHPDLPLSGSCSSPAALRCVQSRMRGRQQCCLQNSPKHTFLRACCCWRRGN